MVQRQGEEPATISEEPTTYPWEGSLEAILAGSAVAIPLRGLRKGTEMAGTRETATIMRRERGGEEEEEGEGVTRGKEGTTGMPLGGAGAGEEDTALSQSPAMVSGSRCRT